MHLKKGQTVVILSGKDKGKTGKIVKSFPLVNKILVEGVNIVKKHKRATKKNSKGQIVEKSMPIDASNASLKKE